MSFKSYVKEQGLEKAKPQTGVRTYAPGQPITTSYKYKDVALEAYQRNPYVYAALNKIADMYADIEEILVRKDTAGETLEIKEHELLDLLQDPNDQQGRSTFRRERILYYLLSGKTYVRKFGPDTGENAGKAKSLWNIQPDAVDAETDSATGAVGQFKMHATGEVIPKEEMIFATAFDPLNGEDGFSAVMSAQLAIDTYNTMTKWQLATMQNDGTPSVAIYGAKNGQEARQIISRYRDKQTGWRNAREPFVPTGDLKIERIGQTSKEADWLESTKELARVILIALGVSPDVVIGGSTFENRKEAMKDLLNTTIIPVAKLFMETDNKQLVSDYGDNLELQINYNAIELLQESQNEKYDRVIKAFEQGLLSVSEAREELDKDADVEHADAFYMNSGRMIVGVNENEEDLA